jgi:hypothetical protein
MGPRQIILRLRNEPGQLSAVSALLGANGVDLKALSAHVNAGSSVVAMVVNDHEKAMLILRGNGYDVDETPVIAAYAPDHPGGLNAIIRPLKDAGVNIEKIYLSISRKAESGLIILEVDDPEKGVEALKAAYVDLIEGEFKF